MHKVKNLLLVRHGESEGNVNKQRYFDTKDHAILLTDKGKEQAFGAGARIHSLLNTSWKGRRNFQVCYSPYTRAVQTKDNIISFLEGEGHNIDCTREDPRLREREWGALRDHMEDKNLSKDELFHFFHKPENGESYANVYDRAACFDQWLTSESFNANVIVVAHGEFLKTYMMYKLGWTNEEFERCANPKNCEVFHLINTMGTTWELNKNTPVSESRYYKKSKIVV